VAVRGSIVDVFPSTADRPVRIDLWGDEVDRLTEFSVADQRSTDDLDEVEIFPCRELLPTDEVRAPGRGAGSPRARGAASSGSAGRGQVFDGMESWLPWLADGEHVLFDLVPPTPRCCWSSPAACATGPPTCWPRRPTWPRPWPDVGRGRRRRRTTAQRRRPTGFPRLHLPFDRLLAHTEAPAWTVTTAPEGPRWPPWPASGGTRWWATATGSPASWRLLADGYRVVVAADGAGSGHRAARIRDLTSPTGHDRVAPEAAGVSRRSSGAPSCRR
jgi:transcription-repair coupling factor (superfamily II helicase)